MALDFEKPKKKISTEDWKKNYSFDGGPEGGYVPNMSETDRQKLRAKTFYKTDDPRIEIRTSRSAQVVIVVRLEETFKMHYTKSYLDNKNVRISANGPIQLSFDEFKELNDGINEARDLLVKNVKK